MATAKLKDGREITINLELITIGEYRQMIKEDSKDHDSDEILAKSAGLKLSDFEKMNFKDYRRVVSAFWKTVQEPLDDPNSASVPS